jgi:hypothetical protein
MERPSFEYDYFNFQHSCAACHQKVRLEKCVSELIMWVTAERCWFDRNSFDNTHKLNCRRKYEHMKMGGLGRTTYWSAVTCQRLMPCRFLPTFLCLQTEFCLQAVVCLSVFFWRNSPQWARACSFTRFLYHTQRRNTVGRTPLDE